MQLSGVFESAQAACGQYVQSVEKMKAKQEEVCRQMEQQTQEKCERMVREAKEQAQAYWDEYMTRVQQFLQDYEPLRVRLASDTTQTAGGQLL